MQSGREFALHVLVALLGNGGSFEMASYFISHRLTSQDIGLASPLGCLKMVVFFVSDGTCIFCYLTSVSVLSMTSNLRFFST